MGEFCLLFSHPQGGNEPVVALTTSKRNAEVNQCRTKLSFSFLSDILEQA